MDEEGSIGLYRVVSGCIGLYRVQLSEQQETSRGDAVSLVGCRVYDTCLV